MLKEGREAGVYGKEEKQSSGERLQGMMVK